MCSGSMRILRLDLADDELVRGCHAVHVAAHRVDEPDSGPPFPFTLLRAYLAHGWTGEPSEAWYVEAEAQVAAYCRLSLPDLENRERAYLELTVHPQFRRRGLGTSLLRHAAQWAEAHGRTNLDARVPQGSAGDAFAQQIGAVPGLEEALRVLDLSKVEDDRFARLRAEAAKHAAGYSLVSWTGRTPEDKRAGVAGVLNAMNDAPREEGLFEDDLWDADRVRERGDMMVRFANSRGYSIAAVHDATGEMAALTQVFVEPDTPNWGHQGITGVTRQHRGHRLGMLTKAAMLEWLATAEPQLEHIVTDNAAVNSYMIAINEALGFELLQPLYQFYALTLAQQKSGG
jgi:GNAT superfamily N-acetyltransferase